eukprot:TRINITY_DN3890_c0_g1_i3.p1 TRINITY_DN3890_c0_g1~~TRINITY_DN3890_c0_g1_i3.p1  ORF type:complete len:167 (+),score=26.12 TRINITY_DN3890_c0_g1_i3:25-501(+)
MGYFDAVKDRDPLSFYQILNSFHRILQVLVFSRSQLFSVDLMVWARVGVENHNKTPVGPGILADFNHACYISSLVIDYIKENLTGHFCLVLQLYHLWFPVCLLWVVESDALAFEMGYSNILPPGCGVAGTTEENVIGRSSGVLSSQLALFLFSGTFDT